MLGFLEVIIIRVFEIVQKVWESTGLWWSLLYSDVTVSMGDSIESDVSDDEYLAVCCDSM